METKKNELDEELDLEEDYDDGELDIDEEDLEGLGMDFKEYEFVCKPCYNFQSVEFKFKGCRAEIEDMMSIYKEILLYLKEIAIDQPGQKPTKVAEKDKPSEKQLDILKRFGIKYDPNTITSKEASELIQKSIDSCK